MSSGDRLEPLIRSCIDEEVRDLVFPGDMAERVIRARRPLRRRRARLWLGAGAVAACSAAVLVPALTGGPGERTARQADRVAAVPFDPGRMIRIGYVPPGLRPEKGRAASLTESASAHGVRIWRIRFVPARGPFHTTVTAELGRVGLQDARRNEESFGVRGFRSFPVPEGWALTAARSNPRAGREYVVFWEPRAGLLITVRCAGLPSAEVPKVVHGVTLSG